MYYENKLHKNVYQKFRKKVLQLKSAGESFINLPDLPLIQNCLYTSKVKFRPRWLIQNRNTIFKKVTGQIPLYILENKTLAHKIFTEN
ncbi:hypothetical protein K737_300090 [Holospora undulata HU1]|uniref:Uncharacterized protein n=1 Tax=Holospora undulata HU1 TaxID=1321371 RepID=A0A061JIN0_9PROT|nr:hypothetical protein K737_300090 [Holospora undulata HU1]